MLAMLRNLEKERHTQPADEPFKWPGFRSLPVVLKEAAYWTPMGHDHWWSAQVQQRLKSRFESYDARSVQTD